MIQPVKHAKETWGEFIVRVAGPRKVGDALTSFNEFKDELIDEERAARLALKLQGIDV